MERRSRVELAAASLRQITKDPGAVASPHTHPLSALPWGHPRHYEGVLRRL